MAHLETGRYGACAATWRGRIYVFGGATSKGLTDSIEAVNPESGNITTLPIKTIPRRYAGAATIGDHVYIVGGSTDALERVDLATNRVEKCRPAPRLHANAVTVAANDRLWVIGGSDAGGVTGALDIYDPVRDRWETGPPLPMPRECAGFVHNGLIHVVGGYDGSEAVRFHDTYVITQGRWARWRDLGSATSAHHMAVVGDTAYAFGDYSALQKVRACDLRSDSWFTPSLSEPFTARRHAAVAAAGNAVVVAGGNVASNNSYLDSLQIFRV